MDISAILTTTEGRELTRELVIAAITKYGSSYSQGGFDFVSKHLERFCSSFFGPNDISFFKVRRKWLVTMFTALSSMDFMYIRVLNIFDEPCMRKQMWNE